MVRLCGLLVVCLLLRIFLRHIVQESSFRVCLNQFGILACPILKQLNDLIGLRRRLFLLPCLGCRSPGYSSAVPTQGCHNLLGAGADGVMQAMVLSMGALKFSNQHLEFGMEPKDMHRDYVFRSVAVGLGSRPSSAGWQQLHCLPPTHVRCTEYFASAFFVR